MELKVTWKLALRVWWAFFWRLAITFAIVCAAICVFALVVGYTGTWLGVPMSILVAIAKVVGWCLGLSLTIVPIRLILGKRFGHFRLLLVSTDSAEPTSPRSMSSFWTCRIETPLLSLTAYTIGIILIICGDIFLYRDMTLLAAGSNVRLAQCMIESICVIWGGLLCLATRFRYRGGLWSIAGAFLVGSGLIRTVSIVETHALARQFSSPDTFYAGTSACWLIGATLLVVGHLRHRRKKEVQPNTALEPTPTAP